MSIIGIDPGLTTAWAYIGPVVAYGHWDNRAPDEGLKSEDKRFRESKRFGTCRKNLTDILDIHPDTEILAYEWVWKHTSTAQTQLYSGWRALILAACHERDITPWPVAWSTLKSVATGGTTPATVKSAKGAKARRAAWKEYVCIQAQARWSLAGCTDDEADALWVAESARLGRGG